MNKVKLNSENFFVVNQNLLSYSKSNTTNFMVYKDIYFDDNAWDFNLLNKDKRDRNVYKFNFLSIPEQFRLISKMVVLYNLFSRDVDFSTAHRYFNALRAMSKYFDMNGISDIRLFNKEIVDKIINEKYKNSSNDSKVKSLRVIEMMLEAYHKYYDFDFSVLLNKIVGKKRKYRSEKKDTAVNDYIPNKFLNQIVSFAIKDIDDESLKVRHRIEACLIVIMAETGMRVEEVTMLESNSLEGSGVKDKVVEYLQFYTFKIVEGTEDKKLTYTFLTPLALKAYKRACKLMDKTINELSEVSKLRLMLEIKNDTKLKGKYSIKELRKNVNMFTEKDKKFVEKEMKRFIYVSKDGIQKRGGNLFRHNMEEFFIRHYKEFDLSGLSDKELSKIKKFKITSYEKYKKYFSTEQRNNISFDDVRGIEFFWTNPHTFRVTVCTKLFLKNVHLDFVVKHMNHLSEDMTVYYNKSVEFQRKIGDAVIILSKNVTSTGLIETETEKIKDTCLIDEMKSPEFKSNINAINRFLEKNKLKINEDLTKIMKLLQKTNSPIFENELGICISSVAQSICSRREYFSSKSDNYHLGIQLRSFKNISYSYMRFRQKLEIVTHNEKISQQDARFINEYEREIKALKHFINKTLKVELELLEEEIEKKGEHELLSNYENLEEVILNRQKIREEITAWI